MSLLQIWLKMPLDVYYFWLCESLVSREQVWPSGKALGW